MVAPGTDVNNAAIPALSFGFSEGNMGHAIGNFLSM
jgi:hypothetical protein